MTKVTKRDGSREKFDLGKIIHAIDKAFHSTRNSGIPDDFKDKIIKEFTEDNPRTDSGRLKELTVENIQDRIQTLLYEGGYRDVYDSYIIYRYKHKMTREYVKSQKEFIQRYTHCDNNANATVDDNSNVSSRNIGTMNSEAHKQDNIKTSRGMIKDKLKELFPDFDHKQYERDLRNHLIYKHDESSFAGAVAPYTYSAKEVIEVNYNDRHFVTPFDMLYDIIEEPSILIDPEKIVYQKQPDNLFVRDYKGEWTRVTHVTKKHRHRDLYRVKTSFGEDLIVTDNHPMIVNASDIDNTIQASDSLGCTQYKSGHDIEFDGKTILDISDVLSKGEIYGSFIRYDKSVLKRFVNLSEEFGYFIGFFIGDGNYSNNDEYINFSQKSPDILHKINDYLFNSLGIAGYIRYHGDKNVYTLQVRNCALYYLMRDYFHIADKSYNKTLPLNILETNEKFAIGILEGLYDADGTANYKQLWLKLASRAAVMQVTMLMRHFGYTCGNGIQSIPFKNNESYHTNYTLWTIGSSKLENSVPFNLSYKWQKMDVTTSSIKYKVDGEAKITNVQKIDENDSFLSLNEYIYDITTTSHTFCLNNILVHNCVSASMYPFLTGGIKDLGGLSASPHNLDSFCGIFINWIFALSGQFAGAVAAPEFFICFDHYAKIEWGDDYYMRPDEVITAPQVKRQMTIGKQICQYFQQTIYSINQPSGARGLQSAFVNFAYFDKAFFEGMFGNFYFPDGSQPQWDSVSWLQKFFMMWFNNERLRTVMTFPVESFALVYKDGKFADEDSANFVAEEYARGHSFFTYISDTVDSLSSCCRLKNKLQTKEFSFTTGNIGIMTGSKSVITNNLSRITQDYFNIDGMSTREDAIEMWKNDDGTIHKEFARYIENILERVYKYHIAYNEYLWEMYDANLLPVYKAGFINLDKQYLTIGINGLNEAAEYLGIKLSDNKEYEDFCQFIFGTIKDCNTRHNGSFNGHKITFNTECVPAESLAAKNYNWDKEDGYWVPENRNLYASYIFLPSDDSIDIFEKIRMHGNRFIGDYLDGGSAAHLNLSEHLTKDQYMKVLKYAAEEGCQFFGFNIPMMECKSCGYIANRPLEKCPKCGGEDFWSYTRIIGYLTRTDKWSNPRQIEGATRVYENARDKI